MIPRNVKFPKSKSFFLFGPRGVGKTTVLRERFLESECVWVDLLDPQVLDMFLLEPQRFNAFISTPENQTRTVIIDEVQRLPRLLDIVQIHIQKYQRQFVLTGSSSRKLKQSSSNLLAGRAWLYSLYPFTALELGSNFDLKTALERGLLPDAYLANEQSDVKNYLNAYIGTYIEKEIQQERWVKNLLPFRKFLNIAAQMNGKIVNKTKIAQAVGVNDLTVANYFEILEETLLGFYLPAFHRSVRKAQLHAPKFYWIDAGIQRALNRTLNVELVPQTSAYGEAFEHWWILELIKNSQYLRLDWIFSYCITKDGVEIDCIIDRPGKTRLLMEIKSKTCVQASDTKALETLGNDLDPEAERWLISQDPIEQQFGGTRALFWKTALNLLFEEDQNTI